MGVLGWRCNAPRYFVPLVISIALSLGKVTELLRADRGGT